jgi:hypothetical protein
LKRRLELLIAGVLAAIALTGCSDNPSGSSPRSALPAATPCGTIDGRGCARAGERVDLLGPSFSNSTKIRNPLFPISRLRSAVLLGHVDGKPFRTETTLLPGAKTVAWNGRKIRVLLSQYLAYLDGRITEVALDRYAQANDGSVWYLGEDVFDYRNGAVAITEGTWLAGREGPGAMIMPAHPEVGDVYRTENVPGIVFEEVTVKSVGGTVTGPHGRVKGAMVASELHTDGTREDKIFAPGYGEFRTSGGGDLEALALAVPADARRGPVPGELHLLAIGATAILESSRVREWETAAATLARMRAAWKTLKAEAPPPMIAARLSQALESLSAATKAHQAARLEQAAIDLGHSAYDLQLRYRPADEIDQARFELWTQQLRVDAAAGDLGAVSGDVAVLEWIRDRFAHALDPARRRGLDTRLHDLRSASDTKNLPAAADHAARLAAWLRR